MIAIKDLIAYSEKNNSTKKDVSAGAFRDGESKIDTACLSGKIRHIAFDGVRIANCCFFSKKAAPLAFSVTKDCVVLLFLLKGEMRLKGPDFEEFPLTPGAHNIAYTTPLSGNITPEAAENELFYVAIPPSLFQRYFPSSKPIFEVFHRKINQRDFSLLRKEHGHIDYQLYRVIREILETDPKKSLKKIFIKAKLMELLSFQLEQLCRICGSTCGIKKEEADKMFFVRDFIINHLTEDYTLKELAQKAKTNEFTLKNTFKQLFGIPVFGFRMEVKMEKAQQLLTENETSIKQISALIGYKNAQHFSTAFKRKFGLTPSAFRKNKMKARTPLNDSKIN